MTQETAIGGDQGDFQPTLWTLVLRAKDPASPERRQALDLLIDRYWKPVYFFIRRRGHDVESAKDLTQSFFAAALERDFLKNVAPEKGRFRVFLQAALKYFLSDQYDRASAKKRGGGYTWVSAEQELPAAGRTPEEAFFRQWAIETLSRAVARLREEVTPEDFALLTQGGDSPERSPSERKNRLHRLRVRLKELLREIIRPSVELESDVEVEVRTLLSDSGRFV